MIPRFASRCAPRLMPLPKAISTIWHGSPVWFIGENPVVGYHVTPKHVNLLFWSGQAFGEPALKAAGKVRCSTDLRLCG